MFTNVLEFSFLSEDDQVSSMPNGHHLGPHATLHSQHSLAHQSRMVGGHVGSTAGIGAGTNGSGRKRVNVAGLRLELPLDDEDYLVPSPQSPFQPQQQQQQQQQHQLQQQQHHLPPVNTPTNNNNPYMDLINDPGGPLGSATKGSDTTMFPYPPPSAYFLAGNERQAVDLTR
jgi:hypothetical protein